MKKIKLGDMVRDVISGLEGTATERTEYLNGCIQITVQAPYVKDKTEIPAWKIDIQQLEVVEKKASPKKSRTGGAMTKVVR